MSLDRRLSSAHRPRHDQDVCSVVLPPNLYHQDFSPLRRLCQYCDNRLVYFNGAGECSDDSSATDYRTVKLILSHTQCQLFVTYPIQNAWNPKKPNDFLYNYNAFALAFSGMSIAFDILVLCFPILPIKNLQMPTRRKVTVGAIFWLGGL